MCVALENSLPNLYKFFRKKKQLSYRIITYQIIIMHHTHIARRVHWVQLHILWVPLNPLALCFVPSVLKV